MLSQLYIQNVAVIENVSFELGKGFNVFTGETGAGKSILIDSINAVLGGRTSRELIRTGADKAVVSAVFTDISESAKSVIEELGFSVDENGELMVTREITLDGRSNCKINLRPATATVLKAISLVLIDIHGQHDSRILSSPESHVGYIDHYGDLNDLLSEYKKSYRELKEVENALNKLTMDDSEKAYKIDMLTFQIKEIEDTAVSPDEEKELEQKRAIYNSSEKIATFAKEAIEAIDGFDETTGILSNLDTVISSVNNLSEFYPDYALMPEKLQGMYYELEELGNDIRNSCEDLDFDPVIQNKIEARLDKIFRLKRKYGGSVESVLEFYEKAKAELESIEFSDEQIDKLSKKRDALYENTVEIATKLSDKRKETAKAFSKNVCNELSFLNMPNVNISVNFNKKELSENGIDDVEFYISTNMGEPPKPLAKIASGGELSRIMLSIKNVLAKSDDVDTLIFDEIDTGVSGSAAQKIGKKLKQVSIGRQILCVTHLAQVAAYADTHLLIEKKIHNNRTYTDVNTLSREERIKELARIMGGENYTEALLQSADELLGFCGN